MKLLIDYTEELPKKCSGFADETLKKMPIIPKEIPKNKTLPRIASWNAKSFAERTSKEIAEGIPKKL